ncbi:MAG: hypothetical protein ACRDWT_11110 [Jatrophihabitantaceae bacterium]
MSELAGRASATRLHRPLVARLFGTVWQAVLTCYAVGSVAVVIGLAGGGGLSAWLILLVLLDLLWLRGLTAWASFDDEGVHTRFWTRWDYPWDRIGKITLLRLENTMSARAKGAPAILVHTKGKDGDDETIAPALRCGRYRREFATELVAAARARGVKVVVGSTGWAEAQESAVAPFE